MQNVSQKRSLSKCCNANKKADQLEYETESSSEEHNTSEEFFIEAEDMKPDCNGNMQTAESSVESQTANKTESSDETLDDKDSDNDSVKVDLMSDDWSVTLDLNASLKLTLMHRSMCYQQSSLRDYSVSQN